jgi:hypothetical protein
MEAVKMATKTITQNCKYCNSEMKATIYDKNAEVTIFRMTCENCNPKVGA